MLNLSVGMATYNGASYLQEQLDSLLSQTLLPDELVVCDDCSTDGTLALLKIFQQQAPFNVRIYCNDANLGYVKNFEKVLTLCSGKIIFLSDQDDVWFPEKIETLSGLMDEYPDIFVLQADMVLTDKYLNPTTYTQLGNVLAMGNSADAFIFGCATAIRRGWLCVVLPIPADLGGHDNWIHRLALALGVRALHDKPLQYFRRHGQNTSNWLASQPVKMTRLDAFRSHGLSDASIGWRSELERVQATLARIGECTEVLQDLRLISRQAAAISFLTSHANSLKNRIDNIKIPRIKRLPYVAGMWMRGGYRHFYGWKSAAKDIIRP